MEITIRIATSKDIQDMYKLIYELAVYENAPEEVTISLDELSDDGFGHSPVFNALIAEVDGDVVGMALSYIKYSTWKGKCIFLEDIIVKESMRRKGIGGKLFDEVVNYAKQFGAKRLEWQVLDWNKPAIEFYKKYDANFENSWLNVKLVEDQINSFNLS